MNCYKCRWRGDVPGSAHSRCVHPYNSNFSTSPELQLLAMFASVGRVNLPAMADKRLEIKANPHGIASGWFHYPFDFDPIWLENCNGFEKIRKVDPRVVNKHRASDSDASTCEKPYFCENCPERFECFTERTTTCQK